MALSQLASEILLSHAKRPSEIFYSVDVLGSMFHDADLERVDSAYRELSDAGLMENAGVVVSFFGSPKSLYRVTEKGLKGAAVGSAA